MRKLLEKIERIFFPEERRYRFTLLIDDPNYAEYPGHSHIELKSVDAKFASADQMSFGGNSDETFLIHGIIETDSIDETLKLLEEAGWEI